MVEYSVEVVAITLSTSTTISASLTSGCYKHCN
jgi:hypothetical protein